LFQLFILVCVVYVVNYDDIVLCVQAYGGGHRCRINVWMRIDILF